MTIGNWSLASLGAWGDWVDGFRDASQSLGDYPLALEIATHAADCVSRMELPVSSAAKTVKWCGKVAGVSLDVPGFVVEVDSLRQFRDLSSFFSVFSRFTHNVGGLASAGFFSDDSVELVDGIESGVTLVDQVISIEKLCSSSESKVTLSAFFKVVEIVSYLALAIFGLAAFSPWVAALGVPVVSSAVALQLASLGLGARILQKALDKFSLSMKV